MNRTGRTILDADRVTVWVLTDNYYDALRPDTSFALRYRTSPGKSIHAEHGLSYFIETESAGRTGACMFDFGMDTAGVLRNMDLLGLDIGNVEAFALSHGHFDHWSAAAEILMRNREKIPDGVPFYIGAEAFLHRYSRRPGIGDTLDLGQLDRAGIEASGAAIREISEPEEIIPGGYLSGDIERSTDYERPAPGLLVRRDDVPVPDDFRGEQALFFRLRDKGLVVVSGCAHAGIVNTVRHAQTISGTRKVHAVLGGFHLINAATETIWSTIADLQEINPEIVAPAHCTGFEALAAFRDAMPDAFVLNTAGTRYTFEA